MPRLGAVLSLVVLSVVALNRSAIAPAQAGELPLVEKQTIAIGDLALENGRQLANVSLAYETYGRLAPDGRNAILITHGYTSNQHAAGKYAASDGQPGWWDKLIGPGRAIDTDRHFVVASNMLGGANGSTGPRSIDPATGKPYGPTFPAITVADIVRAQRLMLQKLGVRHLVAVAGPSFGGYTAFQWAVQYPDFMDGIVVAVSAPKPSGNVPARLGELKARLAGDPDWHGGWYYDKGGMTNLLTTMRVETLKRYGIEATLTTSHLDPAAREARIRELATPWAKAFDAHSLLVLLQATERYNVEAQFPRIKAKVLYVISRTDALFPPSIAPGVMAGLKKAGVQATYFEIDSDKGHLASGADAEKWAPALAEFMRGLNGPRS
jgi:homoserine O-acetyltransferase/O-succinyltransferase